MQNPKSSSKMFIEVVGQLKDLIQKEGIQTGGKLPSERMLAEQLRTGRSTVREALRSLELLGLIETRRGEGTFLADFKKHQLVEVLSAFIMQQPQSLADVRQTRKMHEQAAIASICANEKARKLPVWTGLQSKLEEDREVLREDVIREIMVAAGNRLSLKIWFLLQQYSLVSFDQMTNIEEINHINEMLDHLQNGEATGALESYETWIGQVECKRGEEAE